MIYISGLTTCLVIDRYSYKQMISNKFTIPDYEKITKKATMDNEFKSLRLRDLRIVATLGVGGMVNYHGCYEDFFDLCIIEHKIL